MQANNPINLTKDHLQVLQYTDNLFNRWSLRKNSYLFKHMKSNLQIPLFIIAQERRISQITQSQSIIIQALKLSEFVQVNQQSRSIVIVDLPTLKFQDELNFIKMQNEVKMFIKQKDSQDKIKVVKPLEYIISSKTQDGFYYLTLKTKKSADKNLLKQIAQKHNKSKEQKIKYIEEPLYEDIKQSITKLRKSRANNNFNQNSQGNNNRYGFDNQKNSTRNEGEMNMPVYSRQNMMMYPGYYPTYNSMPADQGNTYGQNQQLSNPGTFIRKAVESDDQQQIQNPPKAQNNSEKQQNNRKNSNSKENKQGLEQTGEHMYQKKSTNPNSNSNNNSNTGSSWKSNNSKKYEQKNNQHHKNRKNNYNDKRDDKKEEKKEEKTQKTKIVLDDNDFPSIG